MTDAELIALVARLDDMSDLSRDHAAGLLDLGHKVAVHQAIAAITTLRAQLAEAHKDGFQLAGWQCLFEDGKTGIVCDDWGNQYCAMQRRADRAEQRAATLEAAIKIKGGNEHAPTQDAYDAACRAINEQRARADRAEAALAAQIEVDAAMFDDDMNLSKQICCNGQMCGCRGATAGEYVTHVIRNQPHDRTALDRYREKVLREAYDSLFKHPGFIHAISGQKFKAVKLEDAAEGILALIEKPNAG